MKSIQKTKKGNKYVVTGRDEIDAINKKMADDGRSILDQYDEPYCKHGEPLDDCMICAFDDDDEG